MSDFTELKQSIDKHLLIKGYSKIELKNYDQVEDIEIYYKRQGYKFKLTQDLNNVYIIEISK